MHFTIEKIKLSSDAWKWHLFELLACIAFEDKLSYISSVLLLITCLFVLMIQIWRDYIHSMLFFQLIEKINYSVELLILFTFYIAARL